MTTSFLSLFYVNMFLAGKIDLLDAAATYMLCGGGDVR